MTPEQQAAIQQAQARVQAIAAAKARIAGQSSPQQAPEADMSFTGRLRDNIVGVDDGVMSVGEKVGSLLNKGGESMTMGVVGDEASAAVEGAFGANYDDRLSHYRGQEAQLGEEHPVLSTAAAIGGALIGPGKVAGGLRSIKGAATAAAGSSAVEGFMEGEGGVEQRGIEAGKSAAVGFLAGGLTSSLAKGASAGTRRLFQKAEERPSMEALASAKNAAYRDVRRSGLKFTGDEMSGISRRLNRKAKTARWDIDPELDEGAIRAIKAFERRAGKEITLNNLDKSRQRLWDVYKKTDEPFVLEAIGEIDNLIAKKADGNEIMQAARSANSKFSKARLLENAFEKARLQTASSGSGGNVLNKYRQAVTRIVTNPNEARWFSDDEITLMKSFIEGSTTENTLRRIGKIGPGGNGLMTALNVYAASVNPAMLIASGAGAGAKAAADSSAMRGSEALLDAVATGAIKQAPKALATGSLSVGAGAGVNDLRR